MREFITGAVVQTKKTSRKMSWCQHDDEHKLDRETQAAIRAGEQSYGYDVKRWWFRYRVNLYRKAPLAALCGPHGRPEPLPAQLGLTVSVVHTRCNATLWQDHGE